MWLTEREHHRKESQHVRSLIVKLFAFQFVNSCEWQAHGMGSALVCVIMCTSC